jgi:hypothetical protein
MHLTLDLYIEIYNQVSFVYALYLIFADIHLNFVIVEFGLSDSLQA